MMLGACAGGGDNATTTADTATTTAEQTTQEVTEEVTTEEVTEAPTTEEETESLSAEEAMIARSHLAIGNNYRVKSVMEKAQAGEDVTIAYLGGSITEGYNAGTTEIYAKITSDYFRDNYATTGAVNYVNAGLSGTPSSLGIIRSDRDIFAYDPDILFIEFAVNDGGTPYDKNAFDSLIMKQLERGEDKAVIILFSITSEGYTKQDDYAAIGDYYQCPMISVRDAIWPEIEAGNMTWADWSNDEAHPNENGQALYATFIDTYYDIVSAAEKDEAAELPSEVCCGVDLTDMVMYDKNNLAVSSLGSFVEKNGLASFPEGWFKADTETDNAPFTFEIDCKALFIVYKDTSSAKFGFAEVYVDGEKYGKYNGHSSSGWGNPVPKSVFVNDESAHHVVEIKMEEGQEDLRFNILCFGIIE